MVKEPLPIIDPTRCTGCNRCVEVCPTHALASVHGKATLQFPERCTYCTACEDVCPEDAIALPFIVVMAQQADLEEQPYRQHHSNSRYDSTSTHDDAFFYDAVYSDASHQDKGVKR